jgi:AcrR family transcriptional regulator
MVEEIKAAARRHLAADGANLSLRAVARELGLVSSALYRYFASRDELLTALIIDAYNSLGDAVEAADAGASASAGRTDLTGRWLACCHAVRAWALAHPHEYALIYGSPVPGYHAPRDTVAPATRPTMVLTRILADGVAAGTVPVPRKRLPDPVKADLTRVVTEAPLDLPPAVLDRGMGAWIQLFGAVSFELFGRFDNMIEDRAAFFDHQMRQMARFIGLAA